MLVKEGNYSMQFRKVEKGMMQKQKQCHSNLEILLWLIDHLVYPPVPEVRIFSLELKSDSKVIIL